MELITSIPNELMADVLCLLPLSEIHQLRKISKSWKNFIEYSENFWPKHFVDGQAYFGMGQCCISIDDYDLSPTYTKRIEWYRNVCFQSLMIMLPDDLKAIQLLCSQNGGKIYAKNVYLHLNCNSTELLQANPNILNEVFHCESLDIIAYDTPFKYIVQNPSTTLLPYVDMFNLRNYYFVPSMSPKEVLNFLFNENVIENRGAFEMRIRIDEIQNFDTAFIENFLKNFTNFKNPGKLFASMIFHCEDFGRTWANVLHKKGLKYVSEDECEEMEVDGNGDDRLAWSAEAYRKVRHDKWTLDMTLNLGNEWLFECYLDE